MGVSITGATQWIHEKTGLNLLLFRVVFLALLPFFPRTIISAYIVISLYVYLSSPHKCDACNIPLISHEDKCAHCGKIKTVAIDFRFFGVIFFLIGLIIVLSLVPALSLGHYVKMDIPSFSLWPSSNPFMPATNSTPQDSDQPQDTDPQDGPQDTPPPQDQQPPVQPPQDNPPVTPVDTPIDDLPPLVPPLETYVDDTATILFDPSGIDTLSNDSFEKGLRWRKSGVGAVNRTTNFTRTGNYSLVIVGPNTNAVFDIGQAVTNGIFICNMYDSLNSTIDSFCGVSGNQTFSANRTILLGVSQAGSKYYAFFDPFGSVWMNTTVPRREGWRQFVIETNGFENRLHIDGVVAGTVDSYTRWRNPFMIRFAEGMTFFDDISVMQRIKSSAVETETDGLQNIALHKSVFASASCVSVPNETASIVSNLSRITNGNWSADWVDKKTINNTPYERIQLTSCKATPCITVDLDTVQPVKNIILYNWMEMPNLYNMTMRENIVQVSKDNSFWTTVYNHSSQGDYLVGNGPQKISFFNPKDMRFIRQCVNGNTLDSNSTWFQIEAWG